MVQDVAQKLKNQGQGPEYFEQHLARLINRAEEVLRQINAGTVDSRQNELFFASGGSTESSDTLTWKGLIRNRDVLEQLSRKMRDIRIEITGALTLLNAYVSFLKRLIGR